MDDPDAIWKPGYDGPPPVVEPARERVERPPEGTDRTEPAARRSRGRYVAVGVALSLSVIAAVVVLETLDSRSATERPDPSVFGGPAARRLPGDAAPLWSADLLYDGDHWVDVIGRELVIAAVSAPTVAPLDANASEPPVTTVVALDASTGEQRWTMQLAVPPHDVTVIGAVDDVLVLEQPGVNGPAVTGVDVATGETRWTADAAPNAGHVGLVGTPFIARLPSPSDRIVTLIDALSGRQVGTIDSEGAATGRPAGWSTDRRGNWYVVDDGEVVAYDLQSELGEATVIGRVDDVSTPRIVVDGRLATIAESGSLTFEGEGARGPLTELGGIPGPIRSLTPVSDSNFVVTSPGSIAGVSVEDDSLQVTWSQNEGAVVADHPVEGGTLLQVATRGGAATQLVDGLTGATVEQLTMVPGALQALVVAGDGIVALRSSDLGATLAGIDLDGSTRWSIAGSAPVVVGDRIVVRATSVESIDATSARSSRQLRVTAYGDAE